MEEKIKLLGKDLLIFFGFFIIYILIYDLFKNIIVNFNDFYLNLFDLGIQVFLSIMLFIIYKNKIISDLKKSKKENLRKYLKYYLIGLLIMYISNIIIIQITGDIAKNEELNRQSMISYPFISFFSTCLLAPFYEEILLRHNFRNLFKNRLTYALVTGILFGSLHLISSESLIELLYIIPYSTMGIAFGLMYFDSDDIFMPIAFHAFNNTFAMILLFLGEML